MVWGQYLFPESLTDEATEADLRSGPDLSLNALELTLGLEVWKTAIS
jgi:hypothetical protein